MQCSSAIPTRRFTEVSSKQYGMNLAYKSAAEVVLRSLPVAKTEAASRTQNANVSNKALIPKHTLAHISYM